MPTLRYARCAGYSGRTTFHQIGDHPVRAECLAQQGVSKHSGVATAAFRFIEAAQNRIASAKSVDALCAAQALLLPLAFGQSLEQTAAAIGLFKSRAGKLRTQFQHIEMEVEQHKSKAELRNRARMTLDEEAAFLAPFIDKAKNAGIIIVPPLKTALERHLGSSVAPSTVYRLLGRHGWRKLVPDKQHPNADIVAQDEWKKNSLKKSTQRNRASKT